MSDVPLGSWASQSWKELHSHQGIRYYTLEAVPWLEQACKELLCVQQEINMQHMEKRLIIYFIWSMFGCYNYYQPLRVASLLVPWISAQTPWEV